MLSAVFLIGLLSPLNVLAYPPGLCSGGADDYSDESLDNIFQAAEPISTEELEKRLSAAQHDIKNIIQAIGSHEGSFKTSFIQFFESLTRILMKHFEEMEGRPMIRHELNKIVQNEVKEFLRSPSLRPDQLLSGLLLELMIEDQINMSATGSESAISPDIQQRLIDLALASTDSEFKEGVLEYLNQKKVEPKHLDPIINQVLSDLNAPSSLLGTVFHILENRPDVESTMQIEVGSSVLRHLNRMLKELSQLSSNLIRMNHDSDFTEQEFNENESGDEMDESVDEMDESADEYDRKEIFKDSDDEIDILKESIWSQLDVTSDGFSLFTKMASHSLNERDEHSSFYVSTLNEFISSVLKDENLKSHFKYSILRDISNSASPDLLKQIMDYQKAHLKRDDKNTEIFVETLLLKYLEVFGDQSDPSLIHIVENELLKRFQAGQYGEVLNLSSSLPSNSDWQPTRIKIINELIAAIQAAGSNEATSPPPIPRYYRHDLIRNLTPDMAPSKDFFKRLLQDQRNSSFDLTRIDVFFNLKNSSLEIPDLRRLLDLTEDETFSVDYFMPRLIQIFENSSENLERRKLAFRALSKQLFREPVRQKTIKVIEMELARVELDWQSPRGEWVSEMIEALPNERWRLGPQLTQYKDYNF